MNLLNVLTNSLLSGSALQALAARTGISEKTLKMILAIAIPLLIKKMTSNASSQAGANSLLGALGQHKNTRDIGTQITEADEEDGAKIVGHILGDEQTDLIQSIAGESGASEQEVTKVLGAISPSILSGLSAATSAASNQQASGVDLSDGLDLGDVMSMFGAAGGASSGGGLLGSLLGGSKPEANQSVNGTQLIQSLLSLMQ